ncbi:MAG: cell division protein ZapA [Spirochaetia bacterium]|nr:cell division protein ZapA [Spirochaetia bacterium]
MSSELSENNNYIERTKVQISGKPYTLIGDIDPAYMRNVAGYVNEKIIELKKKINEKDESKLILLAALNITDELLQLKKQIDDLSSGEDNPTFRELKDKTDNLISLLEEGIVGENFVS